MGNLGHNIAMVISNETNKNLMNLDSFEWIIRYLFGFEFLPAGLYYITSMPYILRYTDVVSIYLGALTVSVVACLYPSIRASRENPAEILRMHKG